MSEVMFFIAAIGCLAGAVGTVTLRNAFYAVLALVFHLLSLAALFLLLRAEFVAAAQVIVYAGAVMVLYVFVVAYVGGADRPLAGPAGPGLKAIDGEGAPYKAGFGTPAEIGTLFLTKFLVAFEVASLLLLVAAVGAVILARRRSGLELRGAISVGELARGEVGTAVEAPAETMLEAGGPAGR